MTAEKRKHRSYDSACKCDGSTLVPFAMESYGARGKQAQRLLLRLADASEELSAAGSTADAATRCEWLSAATPGACVLPCEDTSWPIATTEVWARREPGRGWGPVRLVG